MYLGDFYSYKAADSYRSAIIGRGPEYETDDTIMQEPLMSCVWTVGNPSRWTRRDCTEADSAIRTTSPYHGLIGPNNVGSLSGATNPPDGKTILSPMQYRTESGGIRGHLRGIYQIGHAKGSIAEGTVLTLQDGGSAEVFYVQWGGDDTGFLYTYAMIAIRLDDPAAS